MKAILVTGIALGASTAMLLGAVMWGSPITATQHAEVATITAVGETSPVTSRGDAADDAAIWYNAEAPESSLVLGTDKRRGLEVYDLKGNRTQEFPIGRLNNIDLRYGINVNGESMDVAVATNRDDDSLAVFVMTAGPRLHHLGSLSVSLEQIYGLCLLVYQDQLYAFVNSMDGRYVQYRLDLSSGVPRGEPVRYFRLATQPEGCVADDSRATVFLGEEDVGLWVMQAAPDASTARELVIKAVPPLQADIEGVGLYAHDYLVVSSQGNHRFAILDAVPPYRFRGVFQVEANEERGIGGVRDTDGLAVSANNFGPGLEKGLMVVQDGRNSPGNQNFKYLSWSVIAEALGLSDDQ